jgi:hypothetical protein
VLYFLGLEGDLYLKMSLFDAFDTLLSLKSRYSKNVNCGMRQVALQNLAETHAGLSSHLELVGRAFLQIFITFTLTYRLETWLAFSFA